MATLAGNTIASTYPLLLKVDSNGLDGTLRAIQDGDATDSVLYLATDSALISGNGTKLYFFDADGGEHISANNSGVLSIAGASEIDLTATAIDINGTVDMSSTLVVNSSATITTADNLDTLTLISTDADANIGPNLRLYRNSGSPVGNDLLGNIQWEGKNVADPAEDVVYAEMRAQIETTTDGSEDANFKWSIMKGGTLRDRLSLNNNATVFNDDSVDVDFRVESTGNANMLFVDWGNNKVGIGTNNPSEMLHCASDGIFDGNVKIDSDTKGLVLGDDQDVTFYSDDTGTAYLVRGTDVSPHPSDTEGWMKFFIGDSSAGAYLNITGGEGGASELYMEADGGDDNADIWRLTSSTGGDFLLASKSTGSYVTNLSVGGDGSHVRAKQPAFMATPSGSQDNIALNSDVAVTFGTEVVDQGGNWSTDTFTAPRTAKYQFNVNLSLANIDTGADSIICTFNASNRSRSFVVIDPDLFDQDGQYTVSGSILMDMDTNDTMVLRVRQNGGTQQMDIDTDSTFSGFLAC